MISQVQEKKLVNCRFIGQFDQLDVLGEGTYGTVYRAKEKKTGNQVAIKKMKVHDNQEGFPITSLREVKVLKKLSSHPNIVALQEVAVGKGKDSVFLVFQYCEIDLANLIDQMRIQKLRFYENEVKCVSLQILKGLTFVHQNYIIHRDLKLSNLLLNRHGIVKLADFGLARQYQKPYKPFTKKVVTLWYRAPQILLQMKNYTKQIDTWSVGCIIGELINNGTPLFQGNTQIHQFQLICQTIGFPTKDDWPQFFTDSKKEILKQIEKYSVHRKNNLQLFFDKASKNCIDLLRRLLCWNPKKRLPLQKAIYHPFFYESPKACFPDQLKILSKLQHLSKKSTEALLKRRNRQ